jgi:hypothetical protein
LPIHRIGVRAGQPPGPLPERWSDVTEISYRPSADGYIKTKDGVLGMVIEGITDQ